MLIYLNRTAYEIGAAGELDRQFYEWMSRNLGSFVEWSTDYLSRAPQNADTEQLRRTIARVATDAQAATERGDTWARLADLNRQLPLLLGPGVEGAREGIEGPPTPRLVNPHIEEEDEAAGSAAPPRRRGGVALEGDREREELLAEMRGRSVPPGRLLPTSESGMNQDYVYADGRILRLHSGVEAWVELLRPRGGPSTEADSRQGAGGHSG
jgi:hypothetical protein